MTWPTVPGGYRETFPKWASGAGAWTRQPAILLAHSTEGSSWPSSTYAAGGGIPHATIWAQKRQTRQHYPTTVAARALQNRAGGVETNRAGAIQFEIIGYAKSLATDLTAEDWRYVAEVFRIYGGACSIPLVSTVGWRPYPASYGLNAPQRLTGAQWNAYKGILGHQHVPENDHGDPGNIWPQLAQAINQGGEDMPITDADAKRIAQEVWRGTKIKRAGSKFADKDGYVTVIQDLADDLTSDIQQLGLIKQLVAKVDALAEDVAALKR